MQPQIHAIQFALDNSPVISTPKFSCKRVKQKARAKPAAARRSLVNCNDRYVAGERDSNHCLKERWLSPERAPLRRLSTLISSSRSGQ